MGDVSKKYTGDNYVLASGTLVVRSGQSAKIVPLPSGPNPLTLQIEFEDSYLFPAQVEAAPIAGTNVTKVLSRNFSAVQGTVASAPTLVGTIAGRQVHLDMVVHHYQTSAGLLAGHLKTLTYTVTIAGPADVG